MINIELTSDWLALQSNKHPELTAVIDDKTLLTYSQLNEKVNSTAFQLYELGLQGNTNVAVLASHSLQFISLIYALWEIGIVPVVLNPKLTESEQKNRIEQADCETVFFDSQNHRVNNSSDDFYKFVDYARFQFQAQQNFISSFQKSNSTALMLFTSGTSGDAKAVELDFESLYYNALAVDFISPHNKGDMWLASLPFYHIGGFAIITRSLLTTSTLVIPKSFDTNELVYNFDNYSIKSVSFVSTTLKRLLDRGYKPPSTLKNIFVGGGHIERELIERGINSGYNLIKVYGSTETASMAAAITSDELRHKPDSAGKPLSDNEIIILDDNKKILPSNQTGEIAVKTKAIMKGYYKNDKATKKKFHNRFYLTNDLGWLDDENYLYVLGRKDDIIITGGENVNPDEIETELTKIKQIDEAAVFGLKDPEWTEKIAAAVVLSFGAQITKVEIKNLLRKSLANFKIPKTIYFVGELPKTALGKVNKQKLKSLLNLE